jgi:hypothetical protein
LFTVAEAEEASELVACAEISDANCDPFSSSDTRFDVGVFEEKKATQFVLIADSAAELPPDDEEVVEDVADELGLPGDEPLPQPASARPNTAAIVGSRRTRWVMSWNRMVSASLLTVILLVSEKGARS